MLEPRHHVTCTSDHVHILMPSLSSILLRAAWGPDKMFVNNKFVVNVESLHKPVNHKPINTSPSEFLSGGARPNIIF